MFITQYFFALFVKANEDLADKIIETESDEVVEAATNATLELEEEEKKEKGRRMTKSMIMMKAFVLTWKRKC